MADEQLDDEEKKGGKGLIKIILIVVAVLVLVGVTVGATLFFTGFFDPAPEAEAAAAETAKQPAKIQLEAPKIEKFETVYYELERDMVANLANSRKVMQVKVAIMTHYDEQVVSNIEKHTLAIRSAIMDLMRQVSEQRLEEPSFRVEFAEDIRLAMNSILEENEDFGGIEQVYFSEFIVQ